MNWVEAGAGLSLLAAGISAGFSLLQSPEASGLSPLYPRKIKRVLLHKQGSFYIIIRIPMFQKVSIKDP